MKKVIAALFVAALLVVIYTGAGEYKTIQGDERHVVLSDTTAGSTIVTGTINLDAGIGDARCEGYDAVIAEIIMSGPNPVVAGAGNDDSAWIWLRTSFWGDEFLLDSVVQEGLPCTLRYVLPGAAGTDTVLKELLVVDFQLYDSISDTVASLSYDFKWNIILK